MRPDPASGGPLAQALRQATRSAHRRLDHHPLLAPLVREDLDATHYRRVLRTFHGLFGVLQPPVTQALAGHAAAAAAAGYHFADRLGWLAADLAGLGVAPAAPAALAPPACPDAPHLAGILYVIEGSTLGGQVIARQLAASLGVGAARGGRFFHGHGPDTGACWAAYWRFAAACVPEGGLPAACTAAEACFAWFERGFDAAP